MVANYDNLGMPRASGIVTQLVNGEARCPDGKLRIVYSPEASLIQKIQLNR